jgi:uncharacterized protein (TIGR02145 family)
MTIWSGEIQELDKLYESFKGHLPDIMKELEQLIKTEDPNVVLLYSRRCLEVIITDLCESELNRPRKTEPLKGIIDKLNSEEKVPSHIIASMHSLNSMSTFGTHPKDFDPEQVRPVLNNLAIIIKWYLKHKDFQIISKTPSKEIKQIIEDQADSEKEIPKSKKKIKPLTTGLLFGIGIVVIALLILYFIGNRNNNLPIAGDNNQENKTITIGSQNWMSRNLDVDHYANGVLIPEAKTDEEWLSFATHKMGAWCYYDYNPKNGKIYGRLYNWYAVNDSNGLAPAGWHVPSDDEWKTLTHFLGDSIAANKLRETGAAHWIEVDSARATNDFGFSSLPGGYHGNGSTFNAINIVGFWWTTNNWPEVATSRYMQYNSSVVGTWHANKNDAYSVRCIKNL